MSIEKKKTVIENVRILLSNDDELRNNDKELIWAYWKFIDGTENYIIYLKEENNEFYITKDNFMKATNPAQIIRARALIQNTDKQYLPTDWKVAKARKIERDEWLSAMGYEEGYPNQLMMEGML